MNAPFSLIVLLWIVKPLFSATPFLNSYLDETSRQYLQKVFNDAANTKKLSAIHYGVSGLKILGTPLNIKQQQIICENIPKYNIEGIEDIYHLLSIATNLNKCDIGQNEIAGKTVKEVLANTGATSKDIFFALSVAAMIKQKLANNEASIRLVAALKTNSTPHSLAYGLNAAALLDMEAAARFLTYADDLISQADEIDGKYLQLENGLPVTALAVHGIYALADKLKKSPSIKSDEAIKLTNYLLSRKMIQLDYAAYLLTITLKRLATNSFQVPVVFSLASKIEVTDITQPIKLRICNVLGESVGPLSITLDVATHVISKEAIAVTKSFTKVTTDKTGTLYQVSLDGARRRGFYNLALTAGSQDKRLIGTNGVSIVVKLLAKIRIEDISIAVFDRELTKPTTTYSAKEGTKLGKVLEADDHTKIEIKFTVREAKSNDAVTVHQAFVAFVNQETAQEIIYVATADSSNTYIFDMDLDKSWKDFEGFSGKYFVRLIIGDAAISYALDWNLVDVNMKLPSLPSTPFKKSELVIYDPLPIIEHIFREPEKRPSQIVSDAFSVVCLLPLLVLLILWLRVGINFGNMPLSPLPMLFHAGLFAIFGLYFLFWLHLNMFQTLKYLSVLGTFTFITGNRLLRTMGQKEKEKGE